MIRLILRGLSSLSILALTGCVKASPEAPKVEWKSECIGNYQLTLPGEFEYALTNYKWLLDPHNRIGGFYFSNQQKALFSSLSLSGGEIDVTPVQTDEEFTHLETLVDNRVSKQFQENNSTKYQQKVQQAEKLSAPGMFAWVNPAGANLFVQRNGHIINHVIRASDDLTPIRIRSIAEQFHARDSFESPGTGPALCLPYSYFTADTDLPHRVAVTLRLNEHPDVEIYFKDESVNEPGRRKSGLGKDASEEAVIREFMEWQYSGYAKRAEADWHGIHSVNIAGRSGKALFMRIVRMNGTEDYGYLAYVKGEFSAAKDIPNLMIYVFRNTSSNAVETPVSKHELYDIAKKIVSSIKLRMVDDT